MLSKYWKRFFGETGEIRPPKKGKRVINHTKRLPVKLTTVEIQSGFNRVRFAEGLILQLPEDHDGRNTWLLNYGTSQIAVNLRLNRGIKFNEETKAAETINGDDNEKATY